MKAVVTGGAGFVGSRIVHCLLQRRDVSEVVVLDNLSVGEKSNIPTDAVFQWGDIRDKDNLKKILDGASLVFHNAAFVSIRASFDLIHHDLEVNDIGTLNVLETARDLNIPKVVLASSMAVYGHPMQLPVKEPDAVMPISPYGYSKLKSEYYGHLFRQRYGLKTVILRYFNTYGTKQTLSDYVGVISIFINQMLQNTPITIFGDGTQTRDFIHVEDVAKANILAAFSDAEGIFNVASGQEISINQIVKWIQEETGYDKLEYKDAPPGEISRISADISKARKELHFEPEGNLQSVLPEIIQWWKEKNK